MKIFINAISIKEGGGLVVLRNLLSQFVRLRPDIDWHVAINHSLTEIQEFYHHSVTTHEYNSTGRTPLYLKWWYSVVLPRLLKRINADVLFSQTNYLPDVELICPTLLLEQHAGHFSDVFDNLMMSSLSTYGKWGWRAKNRWVMRSVKRSTKVTVQTKALSDAIITATGVESKKISVIQHGPGVVSKELYVKKFPGEGIWHLGYITKYGVQKNFRVLFDAVVGLIAQGLDIRLHLTLDSGLPCNQGILEEAAHAGIFNAVINHGELDVNQIRDLYKQIDLFVFPSLCESFGFPLIESMAHGIPTLVSKLPSNIELLGTDKYSFSPFDSTELTERICNLMHKDTYLEAAEYMVKRACYYSWEKAAKETLDLLISIINEKNNDS